MSEVVSTQINTIQNGHTENRGIEISQTETDRSNLVQINGHTETINNENAHENKNNENADDNNSANVSEPAKSISEKVTESEDENSDPETSVLRVVLE